MSKNYPKVYYACPCTDISRPPEIPSRSDALVEEDVEEEQPFNPYSSRANYALYPLEYLLFCAECHEIRCPRCYYEDALSFFCPRCLTERFSMEVKSESNRCPQSCHDCPVCFAPLVVNRYFADAAVAPQTAADKHESFILSCLYCSWSSLEIGITFPKSVNISGQLSLIKTGGEVVTLSLPESAPQRWDLPDPGKESQLKRFTSEESAHFFDLADFYTSQVEDTISGGASARWMASMSRGFGLRYLLKQQAAKPQATVRDPRNQKEGLHFHDDNDDTSLIDQMKTLGWHGITSTAQRTAQLSNAPILSSARPIGTMLRAVRCKRCRTCNRQLSRPVHSKNGSKLIINLVAAKYIPLLALKPLSLPPPPPTSSTPTPTLTPTPTPTLIPTPTPPPTTAPKPKPPSLIPTTLTPNTPTHYLLTLHNPHPSPLHLTLATPPTNPGPYPSRITILCPQFTLGAASEHQYESGAAAAAYVQEKGKSKVEGATTEGQMPEAGKVWERGKSWVSVVVEVVPGVFGGGGGRVGGVGGEEEKIGGTGEAVLRVPVFVRGEYSEDVTEIPVKKVSVLDLSGGADGGQKERESEERKGEAQKVVREVAFWCVLDVGRIAS